MIQILSYIRIKTGTPNIHKTSLFTIGMPVNTPAILVWFLKIHRGGLLTMGKFDYFFEREKRIYAVIQLTRYYFYESSTGIFAIRRESRRRRSGKSSDYLDENYR